jgi:hypothetical protein
MISRKIAVALGLLLAACTDNGTGSRSGNQTAERGKEPAADADGLSRVQATIDFSKPATIAEQAEALASKLEGGPIYLDLTIIPEQGEPEGESEGEVNYRVTETPQTGESRPLSCSFGDRFDSKAFGISFNPDYNHLLLEIRHGPAEAFPYATAACVQGQGSSAPYFNIRGYYVVSRIGIPTANDVQLRPVGPPAK